MIRHEIPDSDEIEFLETEAWDDIPVFDRGSFGVLTTKYGNRPDRGDDYSRGTWGT